MSLDKKKFLEQGYIITDTDDGMVITKTPWRQEEDRIRNKLQVEEMHSRWYGTATIAKPTVQLSWFQSVLSLLTTINIITWMKP